jgi:hypothetical protein
MTRFITLSCALLWLGPQAWAKKPLPPPISVCYSQICLTSLRWIAGNGYNRPFPTIEGILINNTTSTITMASLDFGVMSGLNLKAKASVAYFLPIPPGGRWHFVADFDDSDHRFFLTRCETVSFEVTLEGRSQTTRSKETLYFEPLFNPADRGAIKEWEKIHGKRER